MKGYTTGFWIATAGTLQAANDDDLASEVRAHVDGAHADMELSDEEAHRLVDERAYEAADS